MQAKPETMSDRLPSSLFMTYKELAQCMAETKWLVKGLIPADATGFLYGDSGTGKSFIALDMALHVANGLDWCNRKTMQGPVFYIAGEGGAGIQRRVKAWYRYHELPPEQDAFYLCPTPISLNLRDQAEQVSQAIQGAVSGTAFPPRLIIIDTLSQNYEGDENDSAQVAGFLREIQRIRTCFPGCTVLIVHHTPYSDKGRPRGSTAMLANTDYAYQQASTNLLITLTTRKMKDGEPARPISFQLHSVEIGLDEDGEPITSLVPEYLPTGPKASPPPQHAAPRGKYEKLILALLSEQGGRLDRERLRQEFTEQARKEGTREDSAGKGFNRAIKALIDSGQCLEQEGLISLPQTKDGDLEQHMDTLGTDKTLLKECVLSCPPKEAVSGHCPDISISCSPDGECSHDD